MKLLYSFLFILSTLVACKQEVVEYSDNNCKKNPAFIQQLGYSTGAFLMTSDNKNRGLILKESQVPGNPNTPIIKQYQHPSWKAFGWLAPILISTTGDVYTAPAPIVNIYHNPLKNNNTIFKVDNITGEMREYLKLPFYNEINEQNPYGILAMALLCETNTLYVSSIAGSTRHQIKGAVYAIDLNQAKIIDKIEGVDAFGVGISYIEGKRKLYIGDTRSPMVKAATLKKDGSFASNNLEDVFTLESLGIRGDDKAKKIRPDQNGDLLVTGLEFNHNLIAPTEKQETIYKFTYDAETKKWVNIP
jgi:gamma-glutamylcyclotransferase (GGCT)/AIG2-like uncharacterized protein YtfP